MFQPLFCPVLCSHPPGKKIRGRPNELFTFFYLFVTSAPTLSLPFPSPPCVISSGPEFPFPSRDFFLSGFPPPTSSYSLLLYPYPPGPSSSYTPSLAGAPVLWYSKFLCAGGPRIAVPPCVRAVSRVCLVDPFRLHFSIPLFFYSSPCFLFLLLIPLSPWLPGT